MRFVFPQDITPFQRVQNLNILKGRLRDAASSYNFKNSYYFNSSHTQHLYAYCSKCKARLCYRKQQESYRLKYHFSQHTHTDVSNRNTQIMAILNQLPSSLPIKYQKKMIQSKFQISDAKFYYLLKKMNPSKMDFQSLIKQLDELHFETRYSPYPLEKGQMPNMFLTVSPTMKQSYSKFGQFMAYDLTYNCIKQILIKYNQINQSTHTYKWGIGIFCGLSNYKKILPFGISIINSETKQDFVNLFLSFKEIMTILPRTIITDEQKSIGSALQQLKNHEQWDGQHCLDTFHLIKNIQKRSKNDKLNHHLTQALKAKNHNEYCSSLDYCKRFVQTREDAAILNDFMDKIKKTCYSEINPLFCGIQISSSYLQKLNDIIKESLPYEVTGVIAIQKMIKLMDLLANKSSTGQICKIQFENFLNNSQIKLIRHLLSKPIFEEFLKRYVKALSLKIVEVEKNSFVFQDKFVSFKAMIRNEWIYCSCEYLDKAGLPCEHIIALSNYCFEDIRKYIHDRWRIDLANQEIQNKSYQIKTNLGRPKLSRKNRL